MTYKPETLFELLTLLNERTGKGEIVWEDFADLTYTAATPTGSIVVGTRDGDGQPPYVVSLFDSNGDEIVTFGRETEMDPAADVAASRLYTAIKVTRSDLQKSLEAFVKELKGRPQIF